MMHYNADNHQSACGEKGFFTTNWQLVTCPQCRSKPELSYHQGRLASFVTEERARDLLTELAHLRAQRDSLQERMSEMVRERQACVGVLAEVRSERVRQDEKWGEQNHGMLPDNEEIDDLRASVDYAKELCDQAHADGTLNWDYVLSEEIAEFRVEAFLGDDAKTRAELVQVAAVVVAMIECLDRKATR